MDTTVFKLDSFEDSYDIGDDIGRWVELIYFLFEFFAESDLFSHFAKVIQLIYILVACRLAAVRSAIRDSRINEHALCRLLY